jgi:hypothetical protein
MTNAPSGGWREVYEECGVALCCHGCAESGPEFEEGGEGTAGWVGVGCCR